MRKTKKTRTTFFALAESTVLLVCISLSRGMYIFCKSAIYEALRDKKAHNSVIFDNAMNLFVRVFMTFSYV